MGPRAGEHDAHMGPRAGGSHQSLVASRGSRLGACTACMPVACAACTPVLQAQLHARLYCKHGCMRACILHVPPAHAHAHAHAHRPEAHVEASAHVHTHAHMHMCMHMHMPTVQRLSLRPLRSAMARWVSSACLRRSSSRASSYFLRWPSSSLS